MSESTLPRKVRFPKCQCAGVRDEISDFKKILTCENFDKPATELAEYLLGKVLCRRFNNGNIVKGVIVETEAYLGGPDKASHSYQGKKTQRNQAMFMLPGTAYVYMTYGMYFCFNISSRGEGAAVLLRAIEPIYGIDIMRNTKKNFKRGKTSHSCHKTICVKEICNGPSKLCMALDIDKKLNCVDIAMSELLWIEDNFDIDSVDIVRCSRIGIGPTAKEWCTKPLRFYIKNNPYVSKKAEDDSETNV